MNVYKELNKVIEYIEEHLEENVKPKQLAKIVGIKKK